MKLITVCLESLAIYIFGKVSQKFLNEAYIS